MHWRTLFLMVGIALPTRALTGQERPFWGALTPGPHPVGFDSSWAADYSRVFEGAHADERHPGAKLPRPVLVNRWYPALEDGERMPHAAYFDLPGGEPHLDELSRALADYAHAVLVEWTLDRQPGALQEWDREELARLLRTPTACVRDAAEAPGPFPLLVYHGGYGSSFEDNSVLCEYLASHGYVVVGSAFLDETGESFNIDGKAGSTRDFAFLIGTLASAPNVDWNRVGIAGHSGGAHAALSFQAQPMAAVDAVVSLDTTQDYVSALDPHWRHPQRMLDNVEHQTAPLLAVAGSHAFFQACDALVHTERHYLTFGALGHNDYTSQGMLRAQVDARRATAEGAENAGELEAHAALVRRGFEQCSEYVRLFLDAHLRDDATARAHLRALYLETPLGGAEPHVELVAKGATGPDPHDLEKGLPPTPRQIVSMLTTGDAGPVLELLQHFHELEPNAPIYDRQFAYAVLYDLVARHYEAAAAELAPFVHELHPDLVATFLWWVDRASGAPYREFQRHALTAALLLEPENEDVQGRLADLESE